MVSLCNVEVRLSDMSGAWAFECLRAWCQLYLSVISHILRRGQV